MPGHEGSPYWAVVDFDSEGEDVPSPPPSHRVYLDPWDNEAHGIIQDQQEQDSSPEENLNSFAGEPVSASFYYVPTKNYDSAEEPPLPPPRRKMTPHDNRPDPEDYSIYGRKVSRSIAQDIPEHAIYGERPMLARRRSMYVDEPIYMPHPMAPMIYEQMYGGMVPPPPGYMPPRPRTRMSLPQPPHPHHPEYMMAAAYGKPRRHSRMADAYEHFIYESLSPDYEDWARPFPKTVPDNFHLSRYGHLQIDYSFSWHSLDRLIRSS